MARSLIAAGTGEPLDQVTVDIVSIEVPGMGNSQRSADELVLMREQAAHAAKDAQTWPPLP